MCLPCFFANIDHGPAWPLASVRFLNFLPFCPAADASSGQYVIKSLKVQDVLMRFFCPGIYLLRIDVCFCYQNLHSKLWIDFKREFGNVVHRQSAVGGAPPPQNGVLCFLADRTIGRAYGTVSRLSVVCPSSVTFCIVAKRCVLAKKCLKE